MRRFSAPDDVEVVAFTVNLDCGDLGVANIEIDRCLDIPCDQPSLQTQWR